MGESLFLYKWVTMMNLFTEWNFFSKVGPHQPHRFVIFQVWCGVRTSIPKKTYIYVIFQCGKPPPPPPAPGSVSFTIVCIRKPIFESVPLSV